MSAAGGGFGGGRDSLKEYVRSIGAPGASKSNLFGLGSWLPSRDSAAEQDGASLMANEDNFDAPISGGDSQSGWFSTGTASSTSCFGLSKRQRVIGFVLCLSMGSLCFTLAFIFLPFIALKARKFAVLFTLGSIFSLASFSMLWGPWQHMRHLFSRDRCAFTVLYLGSLAATLYCALHVRSTPLTVTCAVIQLFTLVWFVVSHLPGGQRGLQFFGSICTSLVRTTVSKTLPV